MDELVGLEHLDVEIADEVAKVRRLDSTLRSLGEYRDQIATQGMSHSIGVGLEHIAPDVVEAIDIRKLTQIPSTAKQVVALEAIDWKMRIGMGLLGILMVGIIAKILEFILGLDVPKAGGGNGAEVRQRVEDMRDQVRDEVHALRNAEPASVLLKFNKAIPDFLKPHAAKLADLVAAHKMSNEEALSALNAMLTYSQKTYQVENQEELLGIMFKLMLEHPNTRISFSALGFDLDNQLKNQHYDPAFLRDTTRYIAGITYVDEILKTLEDLIGASKGASEAAKSFLRDRERSEEDSKALGMAAVQRALAPFNAGLPLILDRMFGQDKSSDDILPFKINPNKDMDDSISPEGLRRMKEESKHEFGNNELQGRISSDLQLIGPHGEEHWWGQGFARYDNMAAFSLKLEDINSVNFGDMVSRSIVLSTFDPREAGRFVDSSEKLREKLANVFGSSRSEIDRLIDRCHHLEKLLKDINGYSKDRIPTLYDAFYDGTLGKHFPAYILQKDMQMNRLNWGKLTERFLRYTKDYSDGLRSVKVTYSRVATRYRVFKSLLLGK